MPAWAHSQPVVADVQRVDVMTRAAMPPSTPTGHKQRKIIKLIVMPSVHGAVRRAFVLILFRALSSSRVYTLP
jgi:hypothetical protein